MRTVLLLAGIGALLMGLLWVGQGAGLIHWPASSFMLDQRPWVTRGGILAVIGCIIIGISRVRRRAPDHSSDRSAKS
ncbi:hypothetical protein [Sphingomonas sp. F9_3S_D5_B_2]